MSKKTYRTMQGREVDMEALRARNELTIAVSNESVNARGDRIKGGKIVQPRDQVVAEYYENNPNAVPRYAAIDTPAPQTVASAPPKKSKNNIKSVENKNAD